MAFKKLFKKFCRATMVLAAIAFPIFVIVSLVIAYPGESLGLLITGLLVILFYIIGSWILDLFIWIWSDDES